MASTKRELSEENVPYPKKAKPDTVASLSCANHDVPPRVVLNPSDCDLDFNIQGNGLIGYGLHEQGFGYCWSGARVNVGITRGRYCFGCKVVSEQPVDMDDTAPDQQHVCRLGVSRGDVLVGNLGESEHSFGYGGTGKFSKGRKFSNYGEKFGIGDAIVCCIDLESKPLASIGFSKDGKWLGTAFQFDAGPSSLGVVDCPLKELTWEAALFPHVLLKNVAVQMQFSIEDGLIPEAGYKPWASAIEDRNIIMGPSFSNPRDCEVMMMVGLPASGKTTWAEKWAKEHPEKRYVLLGTNLILDQMKVPGLLRKNNYGERFDRLMDRATGIFNIVLSRAANVPRNYIIDQTNVYKSARKRKLKPFAYYQKIAVVVFPKPEELKVRCDKRFKEMGKEVPPDAVNEMLANFVLPKSKDMPHSDEYFDQVIFAELNRDESQIYLNQMKEDLASLSKNNSSTLTHGGSSQAVFRYPFQNEGRKTDSSSLRLGSYTTAPPSNYELPNQVNAAVHVTELHGSMNSLSREYRSSHIPPVARAPSPCGPYSNNEASFFPRDNAGYTQNYGVMPTSDVNPCSNSGVVGPSSRPNIVGNNMICAGAFPDPYRSGMNEPYPIANARPMSFNYSTNRRPHIDNRGFQPDLHTPPTTYGTLLPYGTPSPRLPHGSFPNNMQYNGGYAAEHQRPRYY